MNELVSHMQSLGFAVSPDQIPLDGQIHRFDKDGKKDAWFLGFQNHTKKGDPYVVAQFGSWKTGEKEEFRTAMQFSRDDKKIIEQDIEKAQKKLDVERELRQIEAAQDSTDIWSKATENPASDYLKRKQIKGLLGTKTHIASAGREVLVPLRDVDGKLWGLQRILPDGTKLFMAGQRKRGLFHVVPFVESIDSETTLYIAEGFATAASVHEATGKPVVVAFDSGNLESVARALKEKYSDKAVIICGDDDRFTKDKDGLPVNPGREKAEAAARAVMGKTVFPVFGKDNGKLTDFNDLHLSEGLEAVRNLILGTKPEFNTVRPLGYSENVYYFISSQNAEIMGLSPSAFTKANFISMMPLEFWETNYPSKQGGFSVDLATNAMMKACREVGTFDDKKIRGAGVWPEGDKVVVNTGDGLWIEGESFKFHEHASKYVYKKSSFGIVPSNEIATTDELTQLHSLIEKLSWKKQTESATLLIGWLMVAPLVGTLKWRPHIWVTGPSGSGKTFVLTDIIERIIEPIAANVKGMATEAGLRQNLGNDAKPVIFDELETDDQRSSERVKGVIELCRLASAETSGYVVKGSAHGKSVSYAARFSAVVSSIRPNLQHEQDRNRFAVLELERASENGFLGKEGLQVKFDDLLTKDFALRMVSRSINRVKQIQDSYEVFYRVLHARIGGRFAQQYGILLAGYYCALNNDTPNSDMAEWVANKFVNLGERATDLESQDEMNCLSHLLSYTVRDSDNVTVTIGELIARHEAVKTPTLGGESPGQAALMRYGVKVTEPGVIAVQNDNPELTKVYRGTKWQAGWAPVLKRVAGAEFNKSVRFHGQQNRCVKIKLPSTGGEN